MIGTVSGGFFDCSNILPGIFVQVDEISVLNFLRKEIFGDDPIQLGCFVTEVSSESRKPCQFPFVLLNKTFNACTNIEGYTDTGELTFLKDPWCSTKVDPSNNNHFEGSGYYGECPSNCPTNILKTPNLSDPSLRTNLSTSTNKSIDVISSEYDYGYDKKECAAYDNFNCVNETQCLDQVFINCDDGLPVDGHSNGQENYEPHKATCPSTNQVCCSMVKPEIIFQEKCSDSPGYQCLPLTKCNLEHPVFQAPSEREILDIQPGGFLHIDHETSLCLGDDEICCSPSRRKSDETTNVIGGIKNQNTPYHPKCGQHNTDGIGIKISNPQDGYFSTQFGEWPHVCMLIMRKNTTGNDAFLGGASLITPGIVVTAAHKVNSVSPSEIIVRCGDRNIKRKDEYKNYQEKQVKTVSIHTRYWQHNLHNDIALVHLEEEFVLDEHLDTICLPEFPNQRDGNYQKGKLDCFVQGWGKSNFGKGGGYYQVALRQTGLSIVDNVECQNLLRKSRLTDNFELHDSFLCGSMCGCEGDGGGPLVCKQDNKFVLAGVGSWGIECGRPNMPLVFASIPDSLCFIHWATKCKHGTRYINNYYYSQCNNYLDEQISQLKKEINSDDQLKRAQNLKDSCKSSSDTDDLNLLQ